MYICIYIFLRIYSCIYVCVYIYIFMYICIDLFLGIYIYIYIDLIHISLNIFRQHIFLLILSYCRIDF